MLWASVQYLMAWLCCCIIGHSPAASAPPLPSPELPPASQRSSAQKSRKKPARGTAKAQQKAADELRPQQPIFDTDVSTPNTAKPADLSSAALQQNDADATSPDLQQREPSSQQSQEVTTQAQVQAVTALSDPEQLAVTPHQPETVQNDWSSSPASVGLSDKGLGGPSHLASTPKQPSAGAIKPAADAVSPMPTAIAVEVAGPTERANPVVPVQESDEAAASTLPLASQTASHHLTLEPLDGKQQQQNVDKHAVQWSELVHDASSDSDAESDDSSQGDSPAPDAVQQLTAAMWSIFGQQLPASGSLDGSKALTQAHPAAAPISAATSSHAQGTSFFIFNCPCPSVSWKATGQILWGTTCTGS